MRAAGRVTVAAACQLLGVHADDLLEALNHNRKAGAGHRRPLPVLSAAGPAATKPEDEPCLHA